MSSRSSQLHRRINSVTLDNHERTAERRHEQGPRRSHLSLFKSARKLLFLLVGTVALVLLLHYKDRQPGKRSPGKILTKTPRPNKYGSSISVLPSSILNVFPSGSASSAAWAKAVSDLEKRSISLFKHWYIEESHKLFDLPTGIPGTGISLTTEATELQAYLDCIASTGEWVYDPTGDYLAQHNTSLPVHKQSPVFSSCDKAFYKHQKANGATSQSPWNVRPSLKWQWKPSDSCNSLNKPTWMRSNLPDSGNTALPSRRTLCTYLRHKNILLIGDAPTHYLVHDLLLDWTSMTPLTCYGDQYCKEHAICSDDIVDNDDPDSWISDERVYDQLPNPLAIRNRESGTTQRQTSPLSVNTRGTVLRYRRTDSMFLNSSPSHPRLQPFFVHPFTGVRDINMYAVADGRRSDLNILYKAPIPYPRLSQVDSPLNRRLVKLVNAVEDTALTESKRLNKLIELVALVTSDIWLPEIMESVRALKAPPALNDTLIIYRSGWRMQQGCGDKGYSEPSLEASNYAGDGPPVMASDLDAQRAFLMPASRQRGSNTTRPDTRTMYFNLQTILQNHLMRTHISPYLGIPFVDIESALSTWKSGFVGGAGVITSTNADANPGLKPSGKSVDCLRLCLPTPGLSLEKLLLGSLEVLFEWGWGGPDRKNVWAGSDFVPARERVKKSKLH